MAPGVAEVGTFVIVSVLILTITGSMVVAARRNIVTFPPELARVIDHNLVRCAPTCAPSCAPIVLPFCGSVGDGFDSLHTRGLPAHISVSSQSTLPASAFFPVQASQADRAVNQRQRCSPRRPAPRVHRHDGVACVL